MAKVANGWGLVDEAEGLIKMVVLQSRKTAKNEELKLLQILVLGHSVELLLDCLTVLLWRFLFILVWFRVNTLGIWTKQNGLVKLEKLKTDKIYVSKLRKCLLFIDLEQKFKNSELVLFSALDNDWD